MKEIVGNILTPNYAVLNADENTSLEGAGVLVCHQVNCQGVMGAGLAKQVRERFPAVYESYKEKCLMHKSGVINALGDIQCCVCLSDAGYLIANIFGQDRYGRDRRYTDYDALEKAFKKIATFYPTYTIRIPHLMGCGLGGGNWEKVMSIIKAQLVDKGIKVEIWRLK